MRETRWPTTVPDVLYECYLFAANFVLVYLVVIEQYVIFQAD